MTQSTNSKVRFSDRVEAYVAARPCYPRAVIEHLTQSIGLTPAWQVVDVGAGTGISSELFLQNGNPVTAVEPNAPMRAAAEQSLRGFANFKTVDGSAEHTTLPSAFADLVIAAQAFHWFDLRSARREFARILKPGGYALLIWNNRKMTGTPFLEGYEALTLKYGSDYLKIRHHNVTDVQLREFFAGPYQTARFPNTQQLDFPGLRNRLLSSSYIPQPGHPQHQSLLDDLRDLFDRTRVAAHVTIDYDTELYYAPL